MPTVAAELPPLGAEDVSPLPELPLPELAAGADEAAAGTS